MVRFESSGKYRLDARLGGGGMAEVFLAAALGAEGFSRRVAIKRVLPGFSDNPEFARMFIEEARISSRLSHPNIVSVLDFDRDLERRLFLVMELVEGKDLGAVLEAASSPVPVPVAIYATAELLRGLGHAHDLPAGSDIRGIVHRDVSPHNLLVSWEGAVKVSDFGIAKARAASEATASVFIKGKPAYMSPEQVNGEPLDGRSDLFAAGIILWEMLVGHRLFVGEDTRTTLASVLFSPITRPRNLRPEIPKDVERVAMRLLERDVPARYATAGQALRDLLACGDAPTDGREAMIACLVDRFPHEAPIRHSALGGDGTGGGRSSKSAATVVARPRRELRSGTRIALAAAATLVGAAGGIAAVTALRGHGDTGATAQAVAKHETPPIPPLAPAPPPIDAGSPPDAAAPAVVAVSPDAGQKDAPAPKPAQPGYGILKVESMPISVVTVDRVPKGETPIPGIRLAVGIHQVSIDNDDAHYHVRRQVTIVANRVFDLDLTQ